MDQQTLVKNQKSRTERAQYAVTHRQFRIKQTDTKTWNVQNGDKRPYIVSHEQQTWNCTCEDFARNRISGLRCKHIEAVRILQNQPHPQISESIKPFDTEQFTQPVILTTLNQPLDMRRVKRRKAPGGTVPYLEGYDVIERANQIFNYEWSFLLLSEPAITRWEKKQMIYDPAARKRIPLEIDGKPIMESVGMVSITGKIIVNIGENKFEHADIGRCVFSGDTPEALDMAIAGCATDCLKRCFRQLGDQFGNSLYDKDIAKVAGTGQPIPDKNNQRMYQNGEQVTDNSNEQEAFDKFLKAHQGNPPANRDILRNWSKGKDAVIEMSLPSELVFEAV